MWLGRCDKFSFYDTNDSQNKVIYCCDLFVHLFCEACTSMRVRYGDSKMLHKFEHMDREFENSSRYHREPQDRKKRNSKKKVVEQQEKEANDMKLILLRNLAIGSCFIKCL